MSFEPRSLSSPARAGLVAMLGLAVLAFSVLPHGLSSAGMEAKPGNRRAHETALSAGKEFFAGSMAAIHCDVHRVDSISHTTPLPGALVNVALRSKDGKAVELARERMGANGIAEVGFRVPDLPEGSYTLVVNTRSANGQEKLERDVQVKKGAKILLVTDKPLYQPGQVIHIRALSLQPFDLKPVAGRELTFEVEDAKGNKVFKRLARTSDFGVASVDFQLADEVNMGDYHVRAILGHDQAEKSVTVKKYVLPKFKTVLTADKRFYLPKETIHAELQTDYFFGKPVAGGTVHIKASTFDVQFKDFQTWEGKTDEQGHVKFDIALPGYSVGQPLQKGDAFVKLEVKVTDLADHSETITRNFTVSDQPIRVSLIPEGGKLVPGIENRVFAAALYPDGSPARCDLAFWVGRSATGEPLTRVKTNESGLAEFHLKPDPKHFRQGQFEQQSIEMVGGQTQQAWGPRILYDLYAEARDAQGNSANAVAELNSNPIGDNLLLRLDKAVYQAGDRLNIDVRSSAGTPTVYLDIVKSGQVLLTRWLDVQAGRASYELDLPAELFGTLEVHAYQILGSGEVVRDSRVVYVQPRDDLSIRVQADKDVYTPGATGKIRFHVTDREGKPTAAALGVLIVDEAVYALQDMQPGLEKVYFTLQEELLKPKTEILFKPQVTIDELVRAPALTPQFQQTAEVLLTAIRPKPPARWEVAPAIERRQQALAQVQQIGWTLFNFANNASEPAIKLDRQTKQWQFRPGLLDDLAKARYVDPSLLKDPFGDPWTFASLAGMEKDFTPDRLARGITHQRMQQLIWMVVNYANAHRQQFFKNGKWTLPDDTLSQAVRSQGMPEKWTEDGWGMAFKLVREQRKNDPQQKTWPPLEDYQIVSAGPDGKFGTADDEKLFPLNNRFAGQWFTESSLQPQLTRLGRRAGGLGGGGGRMFFRAMDGAMPMQAMARNDAPAGAAVLEVAKRGLAAEADKSSSSSPAQQPTRIREYFPETMLWQPALLTDGNGLAELEVTYPDSITTWRLTASASSRGGLLGGVTAPLRVFQDFFVDLDLPVALTQNDEVAFPVAVYNYLKTPQTVKLELEQQSWFELLDASGPVRTFDLEPGQVTSVRFRIRARQIGFQPLTIKAQGSKMSDAVKRSIEVVPDGEKVEKVVSDRLSGHVQHTLEIPAGAVPGASKILVKIYPGVFSQVMEGIDGLLRMPFG
jgi:hypothetical protein